jgi:hypothetical protein
MSLQSACRWCLEVGLVFGMAASAAASGPSPLEVAKRIDRLLADEVFTAVTMLAPPVGDATYLRRVWLDIVGDIPSPEHVTAFLLDPSTDKRERVVRELLDNPQYGQNWARYWRDVIMYRRLEDRAAIVSSPLTVALTEKLNANESWDKIAREFITAKGNVRANGATAIQMAQDGRTEEITAEVSRIFLGIQIQCCQCHDHPYDSWKREQFHELAAFFPRIAVRPVQFPTQRSFEVVASDRPMVRRRPHANQEGRRPEAEHFMPDLEDPSARGTRMQPKFFLTGAELPLGTTDSERRNTLAKWMTKTPWFATALVNRLWAELVGEGFYEPVDDMGPERTPSAPRAVALLSQSFADSGFDVKWLFRAICATDAYQRESRPRRDIDDIPFAANVAQPLRSDQLFNALLTAVDMEESTQPLNRRGRSAQAMNAYGRNPTVRQAFQVAFGYDPSDPRQTISSSIPQALTMMNSVRINLAVRALDRETALGRLLQDIKANEDLIVELYLRTLSREPSDGELKLALNFCESVNNRPAAFEDLLWALLNSSEFSHRR